MKKLKSHNNRSKPGNQKLTRHQHATAHHEAGHAFAIWHFGHSVKKATIVLTGDSAGHVVCNAGLQIFQSLEDCRPSGAKIGRLHERVVALLAGHEAQRHYSPGSVRSYQACSDNQAALAILAELHTPEEIPHVWRYLQAKARNLVEKPMHWVVIQHLAETLLKSHTLTAEQVAAAIRGGFDRHIQQRQARHTSVSVTGTAATLVQLTAQRPDITNQTNKTT